MRLRGSHILLGDERNDEVINLFRLSLDDGSLEKLTDVPYIYGRDLSKDGRLMGYIARFGDTEPYRNCLTLLDLEDHTSEEVLCEEGGDFRMVWSSVNFRPDGTGIVLKLNGDGQRKRGNLAYVDLTSEAPELEILLPTDVERFGLGSWDKPWADNDRFFFTSDETGYSNLYLFDLESRSVKQVTAVEEQAWFEVVEIDGTQYVLQTLDRPHENVMVLLDLESGSELGRHVFDSNVGVIGWDDKNHFILSKTNVGTPFMADEMWITLEDGVARWTLEPKIRLPEVLAEKIEQCEVERVEFPTFDIDPGTGERRVLHAFLMTPKQPLDDPDQRLAVITSFYGGSNSFSTRQQIYCEAGITWLSPAVRGSFGFGKDFAALNDRDLGGDEIIDLFYGARFLEQEFGFRPDQIGIAGGSHGGYATMRALTFPPETNDRDESYDFGFGMSHAGFSSLITFYEATNIPDWIVLEAGDPKTEADKLTDRSPLTHAGRLESPLLLTHGSNDSRVGVTESRQFHEAASELGRPVTYVEFEGQGHGIRGLENLVHYYGVQFDFLQDLVCERNAPDSDGCPDDSLRVEPLG